MKDQAEAPGIASSTPLPKEHSKLKTQPYPGGMVEMCFTLKVLVVSVKLQLNLPNGHYRN